MYLTLFLCIWLIFSGFQELVFPQIGLMRFWPQPHGVWVNRKSGFKSASVTRWWWLRKKLGPQIPSGEEGSFLCSPRPPGLELSIPNLAAPLSHSCHSQSQDTAVAGPLRHQGQGLGWGHSLQSVLATWARGVSNKKGGTQVWCFF